MDSNANSDGKNKEANVKEIDNQLLLIKNKFILKKVLFYFFKMNKSLEMIKYNKKLQKKFDLGIVDYKEYSETKTSIEIEIFPVKSPRGSFINVFEKEDEEYFHIYFNKSQKEVKRYHFSEDIKFIKIIIDYQVKSLDRLFRYCKNIESINFKNFTEQILII